MNGVVHVAAPTVTPTVPRPTPTLGPAGRRDPGPFGARILFSASAWPAALALLTLKRSRINFPRRDLDCPGDSPPAAPLRVLLVVGTRPEAIKLPPVVRRLPEGARPLRGRPVRDSPASEMLDQVLDVFDLEPDVDIDLMRPGQSPTRSPPGSSPPSIPSSRVCPDWLLVQGDTTTAMCAAVAAFRAPCASGTSKRACARATSSTPFPRR